MKKLSLLLVTSLLLSACDFSLSMSPPSLPTPPAVSPAITFTPVPTATITASPIATSPILTPSPSASVTPSPLSTSTIPPTSAYIALVDVSPANPGPSAFGCGDSIVMVEKTKVLKEDGLKSGQVIAALKELFKIKQREYAYGDRLLMNALAESSVIVSSVQLLNGAATVELEGSFSFAGTCDTPRVKEQLTRTVMQFPFVTKVSFLLNGSAKEFECLNDQSGNCN